MRGRGSERSKIKKKKEGGAVIEGGGVGVGDKVKGKWSHLAHLFHLR